MRISPSDLQKEYDRSIHDWPFIPEVELAWEIPRCLLVAVGSRETNMTNEVGDGGHGHGVWQYDDRSHSIPSGFDGNVQQQANTAAKMLRSAIIYYKGDVNAALCSYNAGSGAVNRALQNGLDPNTVTTGKDYGRDVIERMQYLQRTYPPFQPAPSPTQPKEILMLIVNYNGNSYLLSGGKLAYVAGSRDLDGLHAAGIKDWTVTTEQWNSLVNNFGKPTA